MSNYQPLHGLPPLAGLATFDEAQRPGLSVEACVKRLKRFHYAFKRLHGIFLARLTAEPIYELKMAFSLHAHYCAEHVAALRQRVGEMREPPLGLDAVPDRALEIFFDEIQAAPTTGELILGIYAQTVPVLKAALEKHRADTNPLADAPSARVLKFALLEVQEMDEYGTRAVAAFQSEIRNQKSSPGGHSSTIASRRRAGSMALAKNPARTPRENIPPRLSFTTKCRGATRVSPIPTTRA